MNDKICFREVSGPLCGLSLLSGSGLVKVWDPYVRPDPKPCLEGNQIETLFFSQKPVIPRWDRRGGGGARVIFLKCSIIPSIRIHSSTLLTCLMCYEQFATSSNLANHIKICFKAGLKNKWSGIKRLALSELTVISDGRTDGQRNRG